MALQSGKGFVCWSYDVSQCYLHHEAMSSQASPHFLCTMHECEEVDDAVYIPAAVSHPFITIFDFYTILLLFL